MITKKTDFHDPDTKPFCIGQKVKRLGLPKGKKSEIQEINFMTGMGWMIKIPLYINSIPAEKYVLAI